MASVTRTKIRLAIEKEDFAELASLCSTYIQVRDAITVKNVTIETMRVALKINRLRVREASMISFL
jgi:hypothetical protein